LHVVFGHIGIPCFVHSKAQAGVGCGVATALLGGYGDFFNQFGKNFAALGIDAGFFVLDIRPFAVSSHVWSPRDNCFKTRDFIIEPIFAVIGQGELGFQAAFGVLRQPENV
jgi:hypothetical protein